MPDKKITELQVAPPITGDDVGILVNSGTDYQYAFSQLLSYISQNIATGCNVTFVTTVPQNNTGKHLDVAININTGAFYQKQYNNWINTYTLPASAGANGSAITYGLGEPNAASGQTNDTYINTANGKFYQKSAGGWQLVFSMLNGPTGGPGPKGDIGLPGLNGKSLLNGPLNPSNQATGVDGDFYINTSTYTIFGPKQNSDWGNGTVIVPQNFELKADITYVDARDANLKTYIDQGLENAEGIKPQDVGQGLTITDQKLTLDLESKQLVSPAITVDWNLFKNDGSTPYSPANSGSKVLVVDKGVKANMTAKYKFSTPSASQAMPVSANSSNVPATPDKLSTVLPVADVFSAALIVNGITNNRSDTITLQKPKSGLGVSGSQVVFASGNDATTDSCSITFRGRGFMLLSDKATLLVTDVQSAYNIAAFQASKSITFTNVTPGAGKYFYYIYDADLGPFTSVIYNDAEQYYGAFQFQPGGLTITNNAGINQNLIVARSNADNAFTNAKLAFS
jgi:hypothetical protein